MKQETVSLKIVAYIRNEGEKRSRKVIKNMTAEKCNFFPYKELKTHALPQMHPGQGKTKVI